MTPISGMCTKRLSEPLERVEQGAAMIFVTNGREMPGNGGVSP